MTHWWNIINKAQGAAVPVSMNSPNPDQLKQEEQYIKTLENQIKPLQDKSSAGSISVEERNTLTRLQQRVNEQKQKITEMKSKPQPTQREQMTTTLQEPPKPVPQQPAPPKNVGPMSPQRATNSILSAQELQALGLDPSKKPTKDVIDAAVKRQKNIKSAKEISDKSVEAFRAKQAKEKGNIKRQKVNVPKMIDLPPTQQMQAEADSKSMLNRLNSSGRYKVERRKPFDAKKWQKQLQANIKQNKLAEERAQKQKRTDSRIAYKDKISRRRSRRKDKASKRRAKEARSKLTREQRTEIDAERANRAFIDSSRNVISRERAVPKTRKPTIGNVTSTGGL